MRVNIVLAGVVSAALVASAVVPSLNTTWPVGVPPLPLTVAVKVTDWPNTAGFVEEVSVATLSALLTVWVNVAEVLVLKLVSPL